MNNKGFAILSLVAVVVIGFLSGYGGASLVIDKAIQDGTLGGKVHNIMEDFKEGISVDTVPKIDGNGVWLGAASSSIPSDYIFDGTTTFSGTNGVIINTTTTIGSIIFTSSASSTYSGAQDFYASGTTFTITGATGEFTSEASSTFTGNVDVIGNTGIVGDLAVRGTSTLTGAVNASSTLGVTGNVTFFGDLEVIASTTVGSNISVGANANITENLTVTGITNLRTLVYGAASTTLTATGTANLTGADLCDNGLIYYSPVEDTVAEDASITIPAATDIISECGFVADGQEWHVTIKNASTTGGANAIFTTTTEYLATGTDWYIDSMSSSTASYESRGLDALEEMKLTLKRIGESNVAVYFMKFEGF